MPRFCILPLFSAALLAVPAWGQNSEPSKSPASGMPQATLDLLHQIDDGYVALFEKVAPSVVIIDNTKKNRDDGGDGGFDFFFRAPDDDTHKQFRMPEQTNMSEGSGFFIRPDGYIIANNHVIEGGGTLTVKLKDGRHFPAKVIATDERSDVAVIKIDATGLPAVEFANSDTTRIGQRVCAIGVPYRQDYSFTLGVVSGKGRSKLVPTTTFEDYIQTDASINPGNSGGPLFDVDGRVIGMNTLINGLGRGLAFAIPSNMLKNISDQLIAKGKVARPWLGVRIESLDDEPSLKEQIKGIDKGVVITTIEADAPAAKSDLRPADVVTAVDGVPVASDRELQKLILGTKIGQTVTLSVWRNGKTIPIQVTTGELPTSPVAQTESTEERVPQNSAEQGNVYGVQLEDLTPENANKLGLKPGPGALVTGVDSNSPASIAEIQPGDVITEIDSKPVANAADAHKLLQAGNAKKSFILFYNRKGQKRYAVLKSDK